MLQPADVAEMLEFGLYGHALSRYSGAWVGLAALSEVVESGATVDLHLCCPISAFPGHRGSHGGQVGGRGSLRTLECRGSPCHREWACHPGLRHLLDDQDLLQANLWKP